MLAIFTRAVKKTTKRYITKYADVLLLKWPFKKNEVLHLQLFKFVANYKVVSIISQNFTKNILHFIQLKAPFIISGP